MGHVGRFPLRAHGDDWREGVTPRKTPGAKARTPIVMAWGGHSLPEINDQSGRAGENGELTREIVSIEMPGKPCAWDWSLVDAPEYGLHRNGKPTGKSKKACRYPQVMGFWSHPWMEESKPQSWSRHSRQAQARSCPASAAGDASGPDGRSKPPPHTTTGLRLTTPTTGSAFGARKSKQAGQHAVQTGVQARLPSSTSHHRQRPVASSLVNLDLVFLGVLLFFLCSGFTAP